MKPVRVIVGFPPGSGVDITARVIGQKLGEAYGQQFLIDNRVGAGSSIGAAFAAKAAPDGYTIFLGTVANAINATLYPKLPFDFARDFAPVALTTSAANVLVVHPSVPARSVAELIKLAKARPGQLSFGSSGTGTVPHLAGELFKSMTGLDIVHIPYKGSPLAVTRSDRRPDRIDVLARFLRFGAGQKRPLARARRHHRGASAFAARTADGRRVRAARF